MTCVTGWDVGGANIKAARVQNGNLITVKQRACVPHHGLALLEETIREMRREIGPSDCHCVTMTAELSDIFPNRSAGVVSIAAIMAQEIGVDNLVFYAGEKGFVSRSQVVQFATEIASANWRISAEFAGRHISDGLFIDMGSTSTDLIPLRNGRVAALGHDDASRFRYGELVYAGFSRGGPQAYTQRVPVEGYWTPLVNESFAAMSDVRRVLLDLPEGETTADLAPTADGRPKTIAASRARLARLAGRDLKDFDEKQIDAIAMYLSCAQMRLIEDQIALLISRGSIASDTPVIGAGVGRTIIARLAQQLGRPYHDFSEFIIAPQHLRLAAANCAPAAVLALSVGAIVGC